MKPFLTAEWRHLLMANYHVDPALLKKYVPAHTELDTYNDFHYISLVGFLFINTRVQGWSFPFHQNFEEVNLRFYVRFKENKAWKRGVVFIKEIVPRRMISLVANVLYNENYITLPMKHSRIATANSLDVAYHWKVNGAWNFLKAKADLLAQPITEGSEEEFITEHYWGYTPVNTSCCGEYEVKHPKWKVHTVHQYDINCDIASLYGTEFEAPLKGRPSSVFLAEGSAIQVMSGRKIK